MDLHIAVANGLGNAKKLVKQLQDGTAKYDFIEVGPWAAGSCCSLYWA